MLRMVSLVSLQPGTDVSEVLSRLQAALSEDGNVTTAEIGACQKVMGPSLAAGDAATGYALVLGFPDRAAYDRYSAGEPHRTFAEWVRPMMAGWSAALYEPLA